MVSINGVALPSPTALSVQVIRRGGSSRYNLLGQLLLDGGMEKRILEIEWRCMSAEALQALSQQLAGDAFFTFCYPDPLSGQREMRCFAADRSAKVRQYWQGKPLWAQVKLTLEEQ